MRLLNRLSIKNKLIVVVLLVTLMTLAIGFSVITVNTIQHFKKDMADSTNMSARLIGWSCIPALAFEDQKGVQDILTRIELVPSIVNVYVYNEKEALMAAFEKEKGGFNKAIYNETGAGMFSQGHLHIGQPIIYQNHRYGTIYVRASTSQLDQKITNYIITMVALMIALAVVTYLLASGFQRLISQPILTLADLTKKISSEADYSVRVKRQSGDEIGILYDGFNNMLEQIHHRQQARERAEEALKQHRDQLEAQVKERTAELAVAKETAEAANAAKSDFLARMSHEIRTPLSAVIGLTNIVLKSNLTAPQRDYLNKVELAGDNLLQVINDILDFSKVEAGHLDLEWRPFALDRLMEYMADLFSEQVAQKELELVFDVDPVLPNHLIGDDARLNQVLTNLITNAIKFTPAGEIVVKAVPANQAVKKSGQTVVEFQVSDTGIGIAADVLPTLFDPFTQADSSLTRNHDGTGLGLAICQRLVTLMGGQIQAKSEPGQGSIFSFTVILEPQKETQPALSLPPDLHGLKALVVDDSSTARQVLVNMLQSFTFNVTAVESGPKAIKALEHAPPGDPYQLVLLDWKMPGMDGLEAAEHIRRLEHSPHDAAHRQPHTPIIILVTAYGYKMVQGHIDSPAADKWLLKPIKPSQLFNTIMELFGQPEAVVPRRADGATAQPTQGLAGQRVLVAEDSDLNREVAEALLEAVGLEVETAENGKIAVDMVTAAPRGHYNAVLMDIQMPEMDGYEATRRIRQWETNGQSNNERLPIIALTAHALSGEKEKCLAADMDDYLAKPIDVKALHRKITKWILR